MRNGELFWGALILTLISAAVLAGPWLAGADPMQQDLSQSLLRPGAGGLFGRDELGRDLGSRLLYGGRISLALAGAAVLLGAAPGVALGSAAALGGPLADRVLTAVMDVLLAFPGFLLALALVAALGAGLPGMLLALAAFSIPAFARLTRAQVQNQLERDFVKAARALGAGPGRLLRRHLLPGALPALCVLASHRLGQTLFTAAGLSYLGLGLSPPSPEWGALLYAGRDYLFIAPHLTLAPGLLITLTALGCNLLADGLHAALDPLSRRQTRF